MADRTYYRLALPAGLPLDVLADLASTFTGEPCTVQEAADHARPDGIVWVNIEQHPVGACREAAESVLEQLREHGQDVAFTVTEDPAYEWLGTICRYQPGLGMHESDCDAEARPLLAAPLLTQLCTQHDNPADVLSALHQVLGTAWCTPPAV